MATGGRAAGGNTAQSFSRNCLLARRMVERGVRFVNIIHASWDHHSDLDKELAYNTRMVDQPIAALIKDLKQRGLLDHTLVVWGSGIWPHAARRKPRRRQQRHRARPSSLRLHHVDGRRRHQRRA